MSSKGKKEKTVEKVVEKTVVEKVAEKTVEADYNKLEKDTRSIPIAEWDWSRVIFCQPQRSELPDGSGHYRRVRILYKYDDNTVGPAIAAFGRHYCFGVQPDNLDKDGKVLKDKMTGKEKPLKGYKVPIVLTSQSKTTPEPTEEERMEVEFMRSWKEEVSRYSIEHKKDIGKGSKTDPQIEGAVCEVLFYKKDEKGEVLDGVSPKMYTNLMYFPQKKEFKTVFYGPGDKQVHPLKMTGHFYITPTVQFEGIYVGGTNIALQYKIYDATVEPISRAPMKRLAPKNKLAAVDDGKEENVDVDSLVTGGDADVLQSEDD